MATLPATPTNIAIDSLRTPADYRRLPEGTPGLVVEVAARSTVAQNRSGKMRAYHDAGVSRYWFVESDSLLVTEYKHAADSYLAARSVTTPDELTPALFPGLCLRTVGLLSDCTAEEESHE